MKKALPKPRKVDLYTWITIVNKKKQSAGRFTEEDIEKSDEVQKRFVKESFGCLESTFAELSAVCKDNGTTILDGAQEGKDRDGPALIPEGSQ